MPPTEQCWNPCPVALFQDLSTHRDWRLKNTIVNLPIRFKGDSKRNSGSLSRRSDSGERCEVKRRKARKNKSVRGGGEVPAPLSPVPLYFSSLFFLRTALHYLNAWNRLQFWWFVDCVESVRSFGRYPATLLSTRKVTFRVEAWREACREAFARVQNSPHFCVFKYARAVKQKVWNEAENTERDWRETVRLLRHALPISLLISGKKPTVLQSKRSQAS